MYKSNIKTKNGNHKEVFSYREIVRTGRYWINFFYYVIMPYKKKRVIEERYSKINIYRQD